MRLVAGVVLVLLGGSLVFAPFASLAVLIALLVLTLAAAGFAELFRRDRTAGAWGVVQGVAYLVAAALVLAWPGATIRVVAIIAGVALLVGGGADLVASRRVHGTARFNGIVGGVASLLLGGLALTWPDVTVLVVAVLFGARTVLAGVRQVVAFFTSDDAPLVRRPSVRRPSRTGWLRLTGTTLGALVAGVLSVTSLLLHRDVPRPDAFYDPPTTLPAQPGTLLRAEAYANPEVPAGARAWRILYTTTRDENRPAVASGLVIVPLDAAAPLPVVAWAHGTTGFAPGCAPSVLPTGLSAGAMMIQGQVIANGWALVATDYVGLGTEGPHPYLIGQGEGRSVLDAVRAARQLTDITLADDTVVWGHSQGGHAALWTGILAPSYAPELTIDGVAALAPASNLPALLEDLVRVPGGQIFASYVIAAYAANYPDVRTTDYIRPGARIISAEVAQRCLAERSILVSALTTMVLDKPIWQGEPDRGVLGQRLSDNIPAGAIGAPTLIGQGAADSLVVPSAQAAYVRSRCGRGYAVDYRTYEGRGHVELIEPDSPLIPDLLDWTTERFRDQPSRNTC